MEDTVPSLLESDVFVSEVLLYLYEFGCIQYRFTAVY